MIASRRPPRCTLALAASLAAGCATNRYRALTPDDRPLQVEPIMVTMPEYRTTEVRDSAGVLVGTEATIVGYHPEPSGFVLRRGEQAIDEQDFYHLAGDRAAAVEIARARARGKVRNRIGWGLIGLFAATTVAGPMLFDGLKGQTISGASIVFGLPIGMYLAWSGNKPFAQKQLGASRALQAVGLPAAPWAVQLDR